MHPYLAVAVRFTGKVKALLHFGERFRVCSSVRELSSEHFTSVGFADTVLLFVVMFLTLCVDAKLLERTGALESCQWRLTMLSSAAGGKLGFAETISIGTPGVVSGDAKGRFTGNLSALVKVSFCAFETTVGSNEALAFWPMVTTETDAEVTNLTTATVDMPPRQNKASHIVRIIGRPPTADKRTPQLTRLRPIEARTRRRIGALGNVNRGCSKLRRPVQRVGRANGP